MIALRSSWSTTTWVPTPTQLQINLMLKVSLRDAIETLLNDLEGIVDVTTVSDPRPSSPSIHIGSLACNSRAADVGIASTYQYSLAQVTRCSFPWYPIPDPPPDILITVNFSTISGSINASRVDVRLGLIGASDDIPTFYDNFFLFNTAPTVIFPGSHLQGSASFAMQDRFSDKMAGALGITRYRRFVVANINSLYPDTISPIAPDPNTVSLRLSFAYAAGLLVEQQYYEKTVLTGFALLGGVWTFISGIFAAIFGSTLFLVIFGIKPLSVYGLVHLFRKTSLVDGMKVEKEEGDHIVAMIKAHLLDVDDRATVNQLIEPMETNPPDHEDDQEISLYSNVAGSIEMAG
ncbi:hypothetical protein P691DRAFT_767809 [Macrolepiota fuliginosa MF-IS2]|uniref:Uncharacterized protein n=1 Tax=Macrolepiota fuliginosa MF-IS2 TaxID=1400762 RepID=A0A9P5WWQ5_9AGAR|nr:hypothetical protein P691DRAFT_767809 [Macrolepiota fuliginosa MF-IS2]